jgi:uncharacterized membrane protein YdjX (TVP38/TMEM64 family)
MFKHKNFKRVVIAIAILLILVGLFFLLCGHNPLTRRGLRILQKYILSYGAIAPLIIVIMILLSTIIPPLPLPVPLVELASGAIFGFWEGWLIVWLGQIISSFVAFAVVRFFNKKFMGKWLRNKRWDFYQNYLKKSGTTAILVTRGTMSSPFNIISFLAGVSPIPWTSFLWATAVGVIPETLLYSFIGSRLRELHIRFIWLSTIILAIGLAGFGITFLVTAYLKPKIVAKEDKLSIQQ